MKTLAALLLFPALAWGQTTVLGSGLVVKGKIGNFGGCSAGPARADANVEIDNCTLGQNALVSIYNYDWNNEVAITYSTTIVGPTVGPFQIASDYTRLVNGNNSWGWTGCRATHVVGHDFQQNGSNGDSADIVMFAGNAVRLAAGPSTATNCNYKPPPNTVELGSGGETPAPLGVALLLHPRPDPAPRNDGGSLYMGMDGQVYIMMPSGVKKQIAP